MRGLGLAAGALWTTTGRFRSKSNPTVVAVTYDLFEKDLREINREAQVHLAIPARMFDPSDELVARCTANPIVIRIPQVEDDFKKDNL